MNLLIIGAASKPGRKIIANALRRGHMVTALVKRPDLLQMFDDNLRVVKGNCHNAEDLNAALYDQHAVINVIANEKRSALPVSKKHVIKSIDTVIPMINGHQIKRFVVIDTTTPLKRNVDNHYHVKAIKNSALDWTLIRPAKIIDKPKTNKYKFGEKLPLGLFSNISGGDMAEFVISNLENESLVGKVITIRH